MTNILDHFQIEVNTEGNCKWFNVINIRNEELTVDSFSDLMAECLVGIRCGTGSDHYKWWRETKNGHRRNSEKEKNILWAYIRASLGNEEKPLPADQIEAVIGETLWYELAKNTETHHGFPVRIEEPHFTVTEPGGDGLAVYKNKDQGYCFRLWEIKKHNSTDSSVSKLATAGKQLNDKGAEYLAKWSKVEQEIDHSHEGLSAFYATMVDKWFDSTPESNAGVAIAKNENSYMTDTPIEAIKNELVFLTGDGQVEAMIITLKDFSEIAQLVRKVVWSGI